MRATWKKLAVLILAAMMSFAMMSVVAGAKTSGTSKTTSRTDTSYSEVTPATYLKCVLTNGGHLFNTPYSGSGSMSTWYNTYTKSTIPYGAVVYVIAKSDTYGNVYVSYGEDAGYIYLEGGGFQKVSSSNNSTGYTETSVSGKIAISNTNNLNVRQYPFTTGSTIYTQMSKGQSATILTKTSNGWYKVRFTNSKGTYTGYVASSYVTVTDSSSEPSSTETFKKKYGYVACSKDSNDLVIYASPSTSSSKVATVDEDDYVVIIKASSNWYYVNYFDLDDEDDEYYQYGYVQISKVKKKDVYKKVKLDVKTLTMEVGDTYDLEIVDKYDIFSNVSMIGIEHKFTSNKKSVAKVKSNKGTITARRKGTAKITCKITCGTRASRKLTCKVKVVKKVVDEDEDEDED